METKPLKAVNDDSDTAEQEGHKARCGCFAACCDYSLSKTRDPFWDNYKGLTQFSIIAFDHVGITFVLLAGVPQTMDTAIGKLFMGLIPFHKAVSMPSYCFITGMFSSANMNRNQRINIVRFMVVWVIQHAMLCVLADGLPETHELAVQKWKGEHLDLNATNSALQAQGQPTLEPPGWLPLPIFQTLGMDWYLWCVIIWRCLLPILAQIRCFLLLSIVLAIGIMLTDAFNSEYSNTPFAFMPFFALGFMLKEHKQKMQDVGSNLLLRGVFILILAIVVFMPFVFETAGHNFVSRNLGCLYGGNTAAWEQIPIETANVETGWKPIPSTTYCQSGSGITQVCIFYVISVCAIFGLMTLIPTEEKLALTRAGVNSIYIYFGQLWAIMGVYTLASVWVASERKSNVVSPEVGIALGLAVSFLVWWLLSQPFFKCLCSPCIEPDVEKGCMRIVLPEEGEEDEEEEEEGSSSEVESENSH